MMPILSVSAARARPVRSSGSAATDARSRDLRNIAIDASSVCSCFLVARPDAAAGTIGSCIAHAAVMRKIELSSTPINQDYDEPHRVAGIAPSPGARVDGVFLPP